VKKLRQAVDPPRDEPILRDRPTLAARAGAR
jgi:hypothetical protein